MEEEELDYDLDLENYANDMIWILDIIGIRSCAGIWDAGQEFQSTDSAQPDSNS